MEELPVLGKRKKGKEAEIVKEIGGELESPGLRK
jgi:hypothetical protein